MHSFSTSKDLFLRLDTAGAGHDRKLLAADFPSPTFDDCTFILQLFRSEFIGLREWQNLFDKRKLFELIHIYCFVKACNQSKTQPSLSFNKVGLNPHPIEPFLHTGNLIAICFPIYQNNHLVLLGSISLAKFINSSGVALRPIASTK